MRITALLGLVLLAGAPAVVAAAERDDFFFVHMSDAHVFENPEDIAYTVPPNFAWMPHWLRAHALLMALALYYPDADRGDVIEAFREALRPYREVDALSSADLVIAYVDEFRSPGSPLADTRRRIEAAIGEIAALGPEFVISTGDLVVEANPATPEVAADWFDLYREITRATGIPFYDTIGNNELAGIWGSTSPDDPGYGKGLFRKYYGRTHYSFDRGRYHFAAVDTHRARPQRKGKPEWDFDRMEPAVAAWLDADLKSHASQVLVVLNHEPFHTMPEWLLYDAADDEGLFEKHRVEYSLAGHIHMNATTLEGGTTHITTGALSGTRWFVPESLHPRGYRLVYAHNGGLYSAWKETGQPALGFVTPAVDPALHGTRPPYGSALPASDLELVAVAADVNGPFSTVSIEAAGFPLPLERWGRYFVRARIVRPPDDRPVDLVLRATGVDGVLHESHLSLPVTARRDP